MNLLLLSAVLLTVEASPLDNCDWGPSYWCQSYDVATRCGKTQFCSKEVWKNEVKPEVSQTPNWIMSDVECLLCKDVVGYVLHLVEENKTEDEAKVLIKQVCNYMGPVATECRSFVDEFMDFVWKEVQNHVDADIICQKINLCNSSSSEALVVKHVPTPLSATSLSVQCKICDFIAELIVIMMNSDNTKDQVKEAMLRACTIPKPVESECDKMVEDHFDDMWDKLQNKAQSSQEVCAELLDSCPKPSSQHKRSLQSVKKFHPLCTICELALKEVLKKLVNFPLENMTEKEADKLCAAVPKDDNAKCTAILNDIIDNLWRDFQPNINPETGADLLCQIAGLCSNTKVLETAIALYSLPSKKEVQIPKAELCSVCDVVVSVVKQYVDSGSTESQAEDIVEKVCDLLPENTRNDCDTVVKSYFPMIWDLLKSEIDAGDICQKIGLCNSTLSVRTKLVKQQSVKKAQADLCDLCKLVDSYLKIVVDSNTTEEELKQMLEGLCNYLPSSTNSTCDGFVESYFPTVWDFVKDEVDSGDLCTLLGLCNSAVTSRNKKLKLKALSVKTSQPEQTLCDMCKLVTSYLKTFVDSSNSEDKVKSAVESLCALLPSNASSQCTSLINDYFGLIWDMVKSEVDSGEICQQIGLCNSTMISKPKRVKPLSETRGKPEQTLCDVCKLVTSYLKTFVDSPNAEDKVKSAVESLCALLPSNASSQCTSLINDYFGLIWDMVKSEVDSGEICQQIGLCNSTMISKPKRVKPLSETRGKVISSIECTVCELVVRYLDRFMEENSTEAEAEAAVEKLCGILPQSDQSICDSLIKSYFPLIWRYLVNESDPETICTLIGLCQSKSPSLAKKGLKPKKLQLLARPTNVKGEIECTVCEFVIHYLDKFVERNSTEASAETAVKKACDLLGSKKDQCISLVEDFFPTIWQYLMQEMDPDTICSLIKICQSASPSLMKSEPKVEKVQGLVTCFVCGLVMKELEKLVNMSNIENATIETLEKVCDVVPSSIQDECKTLIDTYGKEILDELIKGGSAKAICTVIGLCSSRHKQITTTNFAVQEDLCPICEELLNFTKAAMKSDPSFFSKVLGDFCTAMPDTIQEECSSLVKEFAPEIVNLIANAINAHALCKDIKLCTVYKKTVTFPPLPRARPIKSRSFVQEIACEVCTDVLEEIEALLPKEKDDIVDVLSGLCKKYLSGEPNAVCQFVLSEFGGAIIQSIADLLNPRTDCKVIGLCKSSMKSPSLSKPLRGLSPSLKVN